MKRYEKAGLLNETWQCLDTVAQAHCEATLRLLPGVLLRRTRPLVSPQNALAAGLMR